MNIFSKYSNHKLGSTSVVGRQIPTTALRQSTLIKQHQQWLKNLSTTNIAYIRNEMYKCNYAIMRLNNSNPGHQPRITNGLKPANIFTPSGWYGGASNAHYTLGIATCTATLSNTMDLSGGVYDAPASTYYKDLPSLNTIQWNANYNNPNSNAAINTCAFPSIPCPTCSTANAILSKDGLVYAELVAIGGIEYTDFEESSRWMDERDLYERIRQDTSLITNDSILYEFYHQQQSGFIGQLYEILYIYNRTAILRDSIDINVAQMAHDFIQNMPADNICEQNLRDVYEIYFRTIGSGNADFQENDSILLSSIAIQCPADGCEGVYYARSILSMFNQESFDDSTLCNNETYTFRKKNKQIVISNGNIKRKINNEIKIVPNPTYQNFSINISNFELGYYAEVFDITGKLQTSIQLTNKSTYVNCEQCSKGVLFVRIKNKDGIEIGKPQKVVILSNDK
jgi:hypothetical protein